MSFYEWVYRTAEKIWQKECDSGEPNPIRALEKMGKKTRLYLKDTYKKELKENELLKFENIQLKIKLSQSEGKGKDD